MPNNPLAPIILEMAAQLKTRPLDLELIKKRQDEIKAGRQDIAFSKIRKPPAVTRPN